MSSDLLEIQSKKEATTLILTIIGKLGANAADLFKEKIDQYIIKGEENIIFDFTGTTYISSIGLREVIKAAQSITKANIKILMVCGYEPVMHVLVTAGFKMLFPLYISLEEAKKILKL